MRWRILGPVEVVVGVTVPPVRRPQPRGVLAFLLLNANMVVSFGQLIDAMWGGAAPNSARTQVHACVSQIRRALRGAGVDGVLVSHAGGYRIAVNAGELDLAVFGEHVVRARAAAAAGRRSDAVGLLRAGLELWRGAPLAGAAGAFVRSAAAGLVERQLTAYEELFDLELALGRHGPLVAELRPLVAVHPLRERLVAQLMLALAGSGQQAEALRVYAEARARLVGELGVEPGTDLAATHVRVLRQALPDPPVARPANPRPAQLPADVAAFAGRLAPLRQLDQLLGEGVNRSSRSVRRTRRGWELSQSLGLVGGTMARGQPGGHGGCLLLVVDRRPWWPDVGVPRVCRDLDVGFGPAG